MSTKAGDVLSLDQALEAFKFYEEAAERTKGHAWSQTTWILTLNAGILAFSLNLYAEYSTKIPFIAFLVIEWISCIAGLTLCGMLFFCDPRAWDTYCDLLGNSEQGGG